MNRVCTNIRGFDELIEGGFPEKSANIIMGSYGTGKSIFALEFIYNGALNGEPGIYVNLEEDDEKLLQQADACGFDRMRALVEEGKVIFVNIDADKVSKDTLDHIKAAVSRSKAKRLVVDSVSALGMHAPIYSIAQNIILQQTRGMGNIIQSAVDPKDLKRDYIYNFMRSINRFGTTSLLICHDDDDKTVERMAEYIADGVILLNFQDAGEKTGRKIIVRKVRSTRTDINPLPFEITERGIVIMKT